MLAALQRFFLYIFFFSLNFEVWDPFETGGFFSIARFAGLCYFAVSLPFFLSYNTGQAIMPVFRTILIFFAILVFMNMLYAASRKDEIFDSTIFQNIVLFWILINHEQREPRILEKGLLIFALGSAVVAFLYFFGIGIEYMEGRVTIFGDNQNIIGQRMCISLLFILWTVFYNRLELKKSRYLLLLLVPVMMSLLIATGSRLAFLSFALAFIAGLVLFKTNDVRYKIILFFAGIAIFFAFWQISMQNEVLRYRLLLSLQEGQLSNRDVIWKGIFPLIQDHPLFGVGQTGYNAYCHARFGGYVNPHSVIMEILCFTGIAGLAVYFWFLYRVFLLGYRSYKSEGAVLPVLFFIIIGGMLVGSHILEVKPGWAMLAYISCSNCYRMQVPRENIPKAFFT